MPTARENFKVVTASVAEPDLPGWTEVVAHREHVRIEHVAAFAEHLVVSERADGGQRLRVRRLLDAVEHTIDVPEEAASVWLGPNAEFETTTIRYGFCVARHPGHRLRLRPGVAHRARS